MVVVGGFVCVLSAWGIGANDIANSFGAPYGAKALTMNQSLLIAAVFEFVGAFALGSHVSETIRKGIVELELVRTNSPPTTRRSLPGDATRATRVAATTTPRAAPHTPPRQPRDLGSRATTDDGSRGVRPLPPPLVSSATTTVPRARRAEGDHGRDVLRALRGDALAGLRDQVLAARLDDALDRRRRARLRDRLARLRRARLGEDRDDRRVVAALAGPLLLRRGDDPHGPDEAARARPARPVRRRREGPS